MAPIGGLSSNASSGVGGMGGIRGVGGLASGLDRDSLIEQMTYATRSKIAKQGQKKQTLQWQQDTYRSVSSKLVELSTKYMSYASSSNLSSSDFFARSKITALGSNSKLIDVTGIGNNSAEALTILGVKQLAQNATSTSKQAVTNQVLSTGSIHTDPTATEEVSNIRGSSMSLTYGSTIYSFGFNGDDYGESILNAGGSQADAMDKAVDQMNKDLAKVKIGKKSDGTDKTLADVITFETDGNSISMKNSGSDGNNVHISSASDKLMQSLGFLGAGEKFADVAKPEDTFKIPENGNLQAGHAANITDPKTFAERVAGKTISFAYNGKNANIKIGDDVTSLQDVMNSLQTGLDKAFGSGRVQVGLSAQSGGKQSLQFETVDPRGNKDSSSMITIVSGDSGLFGKTGAFHMDSGESNRVNTKSALTDSRIPGISSIGDDVQITINGKTMTVSSKDSLESIMEKINNDPDMGVKVSYLANSDKFSIVATDDGESGKIQLADDALKIFGIDSDRNTEAGKDAIVAVKYGNSGDTMELVRGSNSFTQDGLNFTLKGTFGYSGNTIVGGEEVTFEAKADTEKAMTAVKDMITSYNDLIKLVNDTISEKPNRKYNPLTDEQKDDMTEDEIKKWDEKAKEGLLFNDPLLKNLADDLRYALSGENLSKFAEIGITKSTNPLDNGKLVIDENKLKAALESDPETVSNLFTAKGDTPGSAIGLMTNLKEVTEKYAKTVGVPKGSLIERAGSTFAATSLTENKLTKDVKEIDKYVEELQKKLLIEQDRYIKQFTTLETLISQMNSQSSWLTQQ